MIESSISALLITTDKYDVMLIDANVKSTPLLFTIYLTTSLCLRRDEEDDDDDADDDSDDEVESSFFEDDDDDEDEEDEEGTGLEDESLEKLSGSDARYVIGIRVIISLLSLSAVNVGC
jgi:hypothetical protein